MANNGSRTAFAIKIVNDYCYRKKTTHGNVRFYVCCEEESAMCRARGYIIDDNPLILTTTHSHPPVLNKIQQNAFKDLLWHHVVTTEDSLRLIYDGLAILNPLAARTVTFSSVERSLRRWRQKSHPRFPHSLLEYQILINANEWSKYRDYSQGSLTVETIFIDAETSVTIFGNRNLLSSLIYVNELYLDATFAITPRKLKVTQFMTIMGNIDDTPTALAWAFMTKKTERAYIAVLEYFKNELAVGIHPNIVHQDFEIAMRNAVTRVYPGATIIHCFFHHTQAIYKRLKKKGRPALEKLAGWDLGLAFIRKLMALALLPPDAINGAFQWLKQHAAPDILEFFRDLISYYERWWLRQVTPANFSMYRIANRTNNCLEAYHRLIRLRFGAHSSIWEFTMKLKSLQELIHIEINSLDRGLAIRRTVRQEYIARENVLNYLWDIYDNGTIDIAKFLAITNHISPGFNNDMVVKSLEEIDILAGLPPHNTELQLMGEGIVNILLQGVGGPTPIIRRDPKENNLHILYLQNIRQSLCTCQRSILNVVSLPCHHWFLCQTCTKELALRAFQHGAHLMCGICLQRCVVFKTIQIS